MSRRAYGGWALASALSLSIMGCGGPIVEGSGGSPASASDGGTDTDASATAGASTVGEDTDAGSSGGGGSGSESSGGSTDATSVGPTSGDSGTTQDVTATEGTSTSGAPGTTGASDTEPSTTGCDAPGTWFPDDDGDGFGQGAGVEACEAPPGHVDNADDCDDDAGSVHPGAPEVCDAADNDCDTFVDEGSPDNASCSGCQFAKWAQEPGLYYVYCDGGFTWQEARAKCQSFGGDLAMPKDDAENDWTGAFAPGPSWIGLSDAENEGDWRWIDGEALGWDDWAWFEPNDNGDEDCAVQRNNIADDWNDENCGTSRSALCEQPI